MCSIAKAIPIKALGAVGLGIFMAGVACATPRVQAGLQHALMGQDAPVHAYAQPFYAGDPFAQGGYGDADAAQADDAGSGDDAEQSGAAVPNGQGGQDSQANQNAQDAQDSSSQDASDASNSDGGTDKSNDASDDSGDEPSEDAGSQSDNGDSDE